MEISERKNGITSYLRTKYEGDQPRVAEKEYVFVTQERRLHIENLDYFQEYVIKVIPYSLIFSRIRILQTISMYGFIYCNI